MSNRKKNEPIEVNGKAAVGGIDAARILSQKAKEKGIDRTYSRDTIYKRYRDGLLVPAIETPAGNLYYVEDIEKIEINPHIGKKSKSEEERRSWYTERNKKTGMPTP